MIMTALRSIDALDGKLRDFYAKHKGGEGNVIIATALSPDGPEYQAVFSHIQMAMEWADTFPADYQILYIPYVVDHPDFGKRGH